MDHTFSICAYGESPYLETCIRSLRRQTVPSRMILCTSTPNEHIRSLARKYGIPLYVRDGKSGIRDDWNYAYNMAETEYVTLAHQDDIYHKNYIKYMEQYTSRYADTLIAMTDYRIIGQEEQIRNDISLFVKKILQFPLRWQLLSDKKWAKRQILSLGNPICCPSVCYHRSILGETIFHSEYRYALDWQAFYEIASQSGRFTYIPRCLFYYRIHGESTTQKCLYSQEKTEEEMEMFRRFWPEWMARLLMGFYKNSYKSYEK